jgi:hypothetical protein
MTSENAWEHNRAMAATLKDIDKATGDERKELLTQFWGSSAVVIEDLFPGTSLGYRFATTQQEIINTKEISI